MEQMQYEPKIIVLTPEQYKKDITDAQILAIREYQKQIDNNTYLEVKEVAKMLRRDTRTIIRMCQRGELDFKMVGDDYRIKKSSV